MILAVLAMLSQAAWSKKVKTSKERGLKINFTHFYRLNSRLGPNFKQPFLVKIFFLLNFKLKIYTD